MEAQGYSKLVEALRCCSKDKCGQCEYEWNHNREFCMNSMCADAAAAIEALQAQMPKRGEWIHNTAVYGTTTGGLTVEHHYTCSVCGGLMGRKGDKFCYNCGAKM